MSITDRAKSSPCAIGDGCQTVCGGVRGAGVGEFDLMEPKNDGVDSCLNELMHYMLTRYDCMSTIEQYAP